MIDIIEVTVFNDIQERLRDVSEATIASAARKLDKPEKKEKVIGRVEQKSTRALYALGIELGAQSKLALANADLALEEEVENDHRQEALIKLTLSSLAMELFWAQIKTDLSFWKQVAIGIRQDWQIVEAKDERQQIAKIFGGQFPMPGLPPDED